MTIKNFSLTQKAGAVLTSFALVTTLVGCGNTKSTLEEPEVDTTIEIPTEEPQVDSEDNFAEETASDITKVERTAIVDYVKEQADFVKDYIDTEEYKTDDQPVIDITTEMSGFIFDNQQINERYFSELKFYDKVKIGGYYIKTEAYASEIIPDIGRVVSDKLGKAPEWLDEKLVSFGAWLSHYPDAVREEKVKKYGQN